MKIRLIHYRSQGLTLIELLLVWAIVAVLAIAVIAALKPVEQMRKTRDKSKLADAQQLLSAYDRYMVSYTHYPWKESTVTDPATIPTTAQAVNPDFSADKNSYYLVAHGEVKTVFAERSVIVKQQLWVSMSSDGYASVCFEPESQDGREGVIGPIKTKLNTLPSPTNDCNLAYGASSQCYVCLPF